MPRAEENASSRGRKREPSRLEDMRMGINQMFTGRSRVGRRRVAEAREESNLESPKTPLFVLPLDNFSTTRLAIPYLNRTATSTPIPDSPVAANRPSSIISSRPIPPQYVARQQPQNRPATSSLPSHVRHNSGRRFVGVDPAEEHLAELAETGRRRRKTITKKKRKTGRQCSPKMQNRHIKRKLLTCIVSGVFLALVLTIYLALALTNGTGNQEFHVVLILIILITTIVFCHSLIRLCMMLINPPAENDDLERQGLPAMIGPGGYAQPAVPIRVALARDEEAAGIESQATKVPPPAYGLWRESVRVDPNRIFWQRNDRRNAREERPTTATRPPSYISENGIDYVVEAAPRSFVEPLPVHPSERGRVVQPPPS